MNVKILFKLCASFCLNSATSWFAAVMILPNFVSVEKAITGLTGALVNGTLFLVLSYIFEHKYESY